MSLYCSGQDLQQLAVIVQNELLIFKKWFDINKLSMNLSKTKYIIFGNKKTKDHIKIKINDIEMERVFSNKFLGVTIDSKLDWKPHLNLLKKMAKTIAVMGKIRTILNKKALLILYNSIFLPYLNYQPNILAIFLL